jgi:hypothetical protein
MNKQRGKQQEKVSLTFNLTSRLERTARAPGHMALRLSHRVPLFGNAQ